MMKWLGSFRQVHQQSYQQLFPLYQVLVVEAPRGVGGQTWGVGES